MGRRELLSSVPIFQNLAEREMDLLLQITTTKRIAAKEVLFRKGDPGNQLYAILSGRLKVMATGADGKDVVFSVMGPGEVIGEIALMDSDTRSGTVVALEASELLTLHRRELFPFLERHPKVAIHLAGVLARRLRRLSAHTEDTAFLPLPARLAKTLLALSASQRVERPGEPIELKMAQQDLADMVGTTRESVNKQLRVWEDEGLLSLGRARLVLRQSDALRSIVEVGTL